MSPICRRWSSCWASTGVFSSSKVVDLIGEDLLAGADQEEVEITPSGEDTLGKAKQIQIRAAQLRVTFDPLTSEVLEPFGDYLSPKQMREEGMREVGVPAGLLPELHELEVGQVERAIKGVGSGREQARDILALRSMRRFRVYREAVALVFQAKRPGTSSSTSPSTAPSPSAIH